MDCPDCAQAAIEPWESYTNRCPGCEARMLACMDMARAAVKADEGPAEECPS